MLKKPHTKDITGQFLLLGTGTSVGVPALGCGCDVCTSDHPRNKRTRCSAIIGLPEGNLLIDTPADLRGQLIREGIGIASAVLYTHEHADHIFGMDDLRLFQFFLGHPVPLYCEEPVETMLRRSFGYAFSDEEQTHIGAIPSLDFHRIGTDPFEVLGTNIIPVRLNHGPRFKVLGFRIGNIAYCTDTNEIPEESMEKLQGLDCLILDGLRPEPHPTHLCIEEAVAVAKKLQPKRVYLTHCSCKVDYEKTNAMLPDNIEVAYDGLSIPLS